MVLTEPLFLVLISIWFCLLSRYRYAVPNGGGRFKRIIDQYTDDPDQLILRHSALQIPGCHLDYELLLILLCHRDLAVHKSGYNAQVDLEQITNGLCKGIKKVGYITSQLQKI